MGNLLGSVEYLAKQVQAKDAEIERLREIVKAAQYAQGVLQCCETEIKNKAIGKAIDKLTEALKLIKDAEK